MIDITRPQEPTEVLHFPGLYTQFQGVGLNIAWCKYPCKICSVYMYVYIFFILPANIYLTNGIY